MRKFTIISIIFILIFSSMIFIVSKPVSSNNQIAESKTFGNGSGTILFREDFEDTDFSSRGWYDALRGTLTTSEHIEGSTACLECRFLKGERGCEGGTPGRHLFNATDEVCLSYYVKYSTSSLVIG